MPEKSPFQIDIPASDVLSYLFPPNSTPSDSAVWIDADNTSNSLSPRQLLQWAKRLGIGLERLGIREGEVALVMSTNHIFIPVAYFGIAGTRRVFSGCNPAYGVDEVAFQIRNTEARCIFVEPVLLKVTLAACKKINFPQDRIFLFSDTECEPIEGLRDWRIILGSAQEADQWQWRRIQGDEFKTTTAVLNYSSGTTGLPKGVMISHQNVIANVEQSIYMRDMEQPYRSATNTTSTAKKPDERWLGFLPLYHAYGQLWSIVAAGKTLTPVYFMRSFSYPKWLENIQRHKVTHIQTAPPVLVMLAKRPETKDYDISSLKNILCGAAPLSKELQNEVSDRFKLKVVQTWGMTELTCSSLHVPGGLDDRSGSVG
ncbi:hypothetical protein LTS18_002901, partial [Coniosporium uncinatum]